MTAKSSVCPQAVIMVQQHSGIEVDERDFQPMRRRADEGGSTDDKAVKGASRQDMALRHYRVIIAISIVLIVLTVM